MPLIKNDTQIEDTWVTLADEDELPLGERVIVSLERWQCTRTELAGRNGGLGIRLRSDQSPALIAQDLEHFDLVAIEFPVFKDGRGFSYARLLRERYGFTGEVRAVGEVLRDQLLFMHRCGFDSFEVARDEALGDWLKAVSEISVWYQPTADRRRPIFALRHGGTAPIAVEDFGKRRNGAPPPLDGAALAGSATMPQDGCTAVTAH